jgi:hypothetical protein
VAGSSSSGSDLISRDEKPARQKDNSYRPGCQEDEKGSLNVYAGGSKCFDEAAGSNTIVPPPNPSK